MSGLQVRLASREDDQAIQSLILRMPMPGNISLAFGCSPSFFNAIEVHGNNHQVIVGELEGRLVGVGLIAYRQVYVNGEPTEVGYLSGLRVDPAVRNTTALWRGFKYFAQLQREHPVPFYLCTIMEANELARNTLTSGRVGLPEFKEYGKYETVSIPLFPRRKPDTSVVRILPGSQVSTEDIVACLNEYGSGRQFYPVYSSTDITSPNGLLRGLSQEDFYVALSGDRIIGVMACWEPLPFRQHIVDSYSGALRWLRPGINIVAKMLGCAPLPAPGEFVPDLLAACIAVRNDDPNVFRVLLWHILAGKAGTGRSVLSVGLAADDPFLPVAKEPFHLTLHSRIYTAAWGDNAADINNLDGRVPYLELGSL